jgi:hypothetical protein
MARRIRVRGCLGVAAHPINQPNFGARGEHHPRAFSPSADFYQAMAAARRAVIQLAR